MDKAKKALRADPFRIRNAQRDSGMNVTETVVWHQGQSKKFKPSEVEAGEVEKWILTL